ncbi:MAG: septum formation initiator family protein [Muribaculaceae bacterium]
MATEEKTNKAAADEAAKPRRKWVRWLTSPIIVVVGIAVFLLFYSDNSYINRTEHQDQIDELRAEIKTNLDSTAYYERKAASLNTDRERLEKIAREQYGMKRDNEDVYIMDIR